MDREEKKKCENKSIIKIVASFPVHLILSNLLWQILYSRLITQSVILCVFVRQFHVLFFYAHTHTH